MKLAQMIMLLIIIQASCMLLDGTFSSDDYTLNPYNSSDIINNSEPGLWDFAIDPTGWSSTNFLTLLASIFTVAGIIAIGAYVITKSDIILLSGVFSFFIGFGAIPIISLYKVFTRDPAIFGCTSIPCVPSILAWLLVGGLIAVFYILACLEWWTGRSTS